MKQIYGDTAAIAVSARIAAPVASLTELKAIPANRRDAGMLAVNTTDGSRWRFHGTSALTGDDILVVAPSAGSGRWLRDLGAAELAMPIAFGTADAAVLLTVPAGCLLKIDEFAWKVSANWTGGSSSAIGVSSSNKTSLTTKGDLLGGATGDVEATLVAASGLCAMGTIGAGYDTLAKRRPLWIPTETIRFDRITSAFTAGTGFVLAAATILEHAGA